MTGGRGPVTLMNDVMEGMLALSGYLWWTVAPLIAELIEAIARRGVVNKFRPFVVEGNLRRGT